MFSAKTAPLAIQPSAMALAILPNPMKPTFTVSRFTKAPLKDGPHATSPTVYVICRYLTATMQALPSC